MIHLNEVDAQFYKESEISKVLHKQYSRSRQPNEVERDRRRHDEFSGTRSSATKTTS